MVSAGMGPAPPRRDKALSAAIVLGTKAREAAALEAPARTRTRDEMVLRFMVERWNDDQSMKNGKKSLTRFFSSVMYSLVSFISCHLQPVLEVIDTFFVPWILTESN